MKPLIHGLHHVTALADNSQKNIDFHAGILGLRLVKKTINFDAPDVYHLYYGNETGEPGTILTFFPYAGLVRGRHGKGQAVTTSFSIPQNSMGFWKDRLNRFNIATSEVKERFNESYLYFQDYDGLGIELVATDNDNRPGFSFGQIPEEHAVKGFYNATLNIDNPDKTAELLNGLMNHSLIAQGDNRFRYGTSGNPGAFVDIVADLSNQRGLSGSGTVHHVAFATDNDTTITQMQEQLQQKGFHVTPVLDRQYFHSIYFREPGGVLFEVATSDIGFTFDEEKDSLGAALKLPPWEEANRQTIEKGLEPIQFNWKDFI